MGGLEIVFNFVLFRVMVVQAVSLAAGDTVAITEEAAAEAATTTSAAEAVVEDDPHHAEAEILTDEGKWTGGRPVVNHFIFATEI